MYKELFDSHVFISKNEISRQQPHSLFGDFSNGIFSSPPHVHPFDSIQDTTETHLKAVLFSVMKSWLRLSREIELSGSILVCWQSSLKEKKILLVELN